MKPVTMLRILGTALVLWAGWCFGTDQPMAGIFLAINGIFFLSLV